MRSGKCLERLSRTEPISYQLKPPYGCFAHAFYLFYADL